MTIHVHAYSGTSTVCTFYKYMYKHRSEGTKISQNPPKWLKTGSCYCFVSASRWQFSGPCSTIHLSPCTFHLCDRRRTEGHTVVHVHWRYVLVEKDKNFNIPLGSQLDKQHCTVNSWLWFDKCNFRQDKQHLKNTTDPTCTCSFHRE